MFREFLNWWFGQLADLLPPQLRRAAPTAEDATVIAPIGDDMTAVVAPSRRAGARRFAAFAGKTRGAAPRRGGCAGQDGGDAACRRAWARPGVGVRNGPGDPVQAGRPLLEPPG